MKRRAFVAASLAAAQEVAPQTVRLADEFVCPMDRDVRQQGPGKCKRCGMKLVANLPGHEDYIFDMRTEPAVPKAGAPARFEFRIREPRAPRRSVTEFELVHEKIFHLFLLSDDLSYFAHEHPVQAGNGLFRFETSLPLPGAYRVVADCYPKGATPQFLVRTLHTAGALGPEAMGRAKLKADVAPKQGRNLRVDLITEPSRPIAGQETLLFFRLSPAEGLEQFLAAWGHMLVASEDLIDLIHDHPLYSYPEATDKLQVQFNLIFPREMIYRVHVQFQRRGVVNTVAFNVPVRQLR